MKTILSFLTYFCFFAFAFWLTSCERGQEQLPEDAMQGIALQDMLEEAEYWEGNKLEYKDLFFINDKDLFTQKDSNKTYSE